jgi:sugar phosphate isomerase/epimerase
MTIDQHHLAYCTNIHPAETWEETWEVLKTDVLAVRDRVLRTAPRISDPESPIPADRFAIGLRLSARAATELLDGGHLSAFRSWLASEDCYVFTINGFPYGAFHGTRVKENVYRPDWTSAERLSYTNALFTIISQLVPEGIEGSVSTLPGSFKAFEADEAAMFGNLESCARHIESLSERSGRDLHLGLEPEPLGHFENTAETLVFFERFLSQADDPGLIRRRIGINYDTCHFALEFDGCAASLDAFRAAGLRISKVHLSSALAFDPGNPDALDAIQAFDEPTYLHQVIIRDERRQLTRFRDLPDFFSSLITAKQPDPAEHRGTGDPADPSSEARVHFHIPLYSDPAAPLGSTKQHALDLLAYRRAHPDFCAHFEIETYTWGVLPGELQQPLVDQIAQEYAWTMEHL